MSVLHCKPILLSTATAVVLTCAGTVAAQQNTELLRSGYIEGAVGVGHISPSDDLTTDNPLDETYPRLDTRGAVSFPLLNGWSVQLDVEGFHNFTEGSDDSFGEDDNPTNAIIGGTHLSYRVPDEWLLGLFGGAGLVQTDESEAAQTDWFAFFAGAEGQYYMGDTTLHLQAGYLDQSGDPRTTSDSSGDAIREAGFVRGVARHFLHDNAYAQGEVSYAYGKCDDEEGPTGGTFVRCNLIGWGARYEQAFSGNGLSWFINYDGTYGRNMSVNIDAVENIVSVGIRMLFGADNLKRNERRGAGLDLPNAAYWSGMSQSVID